ncbi:glycosyltransferase family 2 protein [Rhodanobacter terrae]|uniref:Glycosyltransferase family 2 protein n=1 Tax=Rhodanobacter terrae TaxID=418647 RepID=A0ABW0ST11_9GAMM
MTPASVSIVIPVYNRAHLVSRAIDSALAQTVTCEVVLVDHGSTDDISAVVKNYGSKIRYIRRDNDRGPIEAWRDGAESATGEYLHFTYDDDWLEPEFVEKCLGGFGNEVAFVYTRATLHDPSAGATRVLLRHPSGINPIKDIVQYLLLSPLTISPGCAMFRRNDVLKNLLREIPGAAGPYGKNSGVGEDLLLFLLTSLSYDKYAHVSKPLADFLAHPGSITVNAQRTGKGSILAESYGVAKAFYLSQPGADKPLQGFRKTLFRLLWAVRSFLS